ncbi:hypothetical protein D1BOALGB6SA_9256 [Olavius sp. associated proteobacterium Delta 1]|nr:hypothetical protein D1BOALGB6SA_9256 [Olavius sp. associated proteobacterium Delta 1]
MECWNIGTLEYWIINRDRSILNLFDRIPIKTHYSTIPPFQYSATRKPVRC